MSFESIPIFTAAPESKFKVTPEIDRTPKYFQRKEKRFKILNKILDEGLKPAELLKTIGRIIAGRKAKQEVMRPQHQKTEKELSAEYKGKFSLIEDGDYASTEQRKELYQELASQSGYYELNPKSDWMETDGEVQEREFARGAIMQKLLSGNGLNSLDIRSGNLDSDITDLEMEYMKDPERLNTFDRETSVRAIDTLFSLRDKTDRKAIVEEMKKRFGCQEAIFILEDYFDCWEGYKDNTEVILDERMENDEIDEDFRKKADQIIIDSRPVLERYQQWNEYYLVNGSFNSDNLTGGALPVNWDRVGVTNNFLNALIYDYGELRASAKSKGEDEFVRNLDEEIIKRFDELGDKEAGMTVVRLAALRSCGEMVE
jgi:hypothetical protein